MSGQQITAAFPLPPSYWNDLSPEEIRQMKPPEPPKDEPVIIFGRQVAVHLIFPILQMM